MSKIGAIMDSEIAETPDIYAKLLATNFISSDLANLIDKAQIKSILILARGTSDNAAFFFKYLVETQLGLPCGLTSPSSVSIYNSKLHYENTLVVAISQSGKSTDLVQFARAANSSGAKLVSITNDSNSPLAESADFHLPLLAGPEIAVAATKSYSAQLLISYLLVMAWAKKKVNLETLVKEAREVLANRTHVKEIAKLIDLKKQLVVLGRGFSYPNAKEAALKIQETCKVSVQGMSSADYLHGPISSLDSNSQVIIMAPCCSPDNLMAEAIEKIRPITKEIFWIGAGAQITGDEQSFGGANCGDEITSAIVDAIILQELALNLAIAAGLNPDAPEGLSKVTLTI